MAGLGDSLTVGLLLVIVFGAVCFYLYSRLSQNEKRVSLLENLLLSLKMNTEASLMGPDGADGPDSVEPVSGPAPLESNDVDEEEYSEMLQGLPARSATPTPTPNDEDDELLRAAAEVATETAAPARKMDANYESMSLKELEGLAKERGITGVPKRKRDLIDALKKQGEAPPAAPVPMDSAPAELVEGFNVEINA